METKESVVENQVEQEVAKPAEIAPVEVFETRVQRPEMEKSLDQPVNKFDVTKLSYEVQHGYRVFVEMTGDSHKNVTWPFMEPVDAEALGLWDYHEKIKEPMSFYQIGCKFNNYEYNSITEVIADMRLILENCYRYNGANHWVSKLGHKMEKILEQKLALLNRSLRDKVSLDATMALKSDFMSASVAVEGTGRRRTTVRNSYSKMINGEDSSSLLTHLKIQEDIEERERRRIREKEKKEANLVLLQDLAEWEEKEVGTDIMEQLHSLWEIPSLSGLLFLLKDFLYIQDLSITELELGFVYANKSSLLARIYTALLLTPHQRKSLFKKPPMKFKVWESKLCDRMNIWYKAAEKDGQELTCHQYGLDMALFEVLGDVNPLLEKSYMDLSLYQRVWILKCLCDNSLVRDYDFREHLANIPPTDQRELFLGNDADNWSYLYFPIFSATDLRIYKQCPLDFPELSKRKSKVVSPVPPPLPMLKSKVTPARPDTPTQSKRNTRLKQLRNVTPSPDPETPSPPALLPFQEEEENISEPKSTTIIAEGFELVAYDIETLKKLCEQFDEPSPPPKKRGRKRKPPPPRKKCEINLHQTLLALLEELEKYEVSFSKLLSKAKIKIMKESQEPEPEDEPEEIIPAAEGEEWGSEESIGDEIEDAGAKNMSSDEDFVLEDEEQGRKSKTPTPEEKKDSEPDKCKGTTGPPLMLPIKRKAEGEISPEESKLLTARPHVKNDNDPCSISIQTAPLKMKKKQKKLTDVKTSSAAVSQVKATSVPQASSVIHVPSGLRAVSAIVSSVNTKTVAGSCVKPSFTPSGVLVVGSTGPSSNITKAKASSVRIHPKLPVILSKASFTAIPKPKSLDAQHTSSFQTVCSSVASTASNNPSSATSVTLQSPTHLAATIPGIGKVMFVTSSGVPLQVLRAVPVSKQPLLQGRTVTLGSTISTSPLQVVTSSSSHSVQVEVPKSVSVSQQSSSLAAGSSTSTSSPRCSVSSSLLFSSPVPSQVLNATQESHPPLALSNTLNTTSAASSSPSSSVCGVLSSSSLSTSTGVAVPVQALQAQGKILNLATVKSDSESSPFLTVSSTSLPLAPAGTVQSVCSSLSVVSTVGGSQIPSSSIQKDELSEITPGLANILSKSKQTSNVITTNASPVNPPVILIRHPGTGGVVPLMVKGGSVVVPTSSTSQQLVFLRSSNVMTSSVTTSTATVVSTLGHKVALSPCISSAGQSLSHLKPKTTSMVPTNEPLVQASMPSLCEQNISTTSLASALPITKELTTTSPLGSNSTELNGTGTQSRPLFSASCISDKQVVLKERTLSENSSLNKQPTGEESNPLCTKNKMTLTGEDNQASPNTIKTASLQTETGAAMDSKLKYVNPTRIEENVLPSTTTPLDNKCERGRSPRSSLDNKDKVDFSEKEMDTKNCPELSLDLTCYETSVGESTGCEESDDANPNGLCQDVENIADKLCNGTARELGLAKSRIKDKVYCAEQNHPVEADQTSNGDLVTEI